MTDMNTCRETVVQTGSPPTSHVRRKAFDSGMSCNAVGGLVRHTRSLWELIVVDDGSTDGTGAADSLVGCAADSESVVRSRITNPRSQIGLEASRLKVSLCRRGCGLPSAVFRT